ncbi:glycoside hydrolase family 3 protein [Prevotella sp. KH2C16]|uniref:beta-glucosidase n=1 Tax=Prevotella sp. KH2C16 TaxID=1855325 RepID=UPI000B803B36|nr:glycoside hydrolase family 3 C-terminal domain-containing protein [Prevotella sp. KH2C16]
MKNKSYIVCLSLCISMGIQAQQITPKAVERASAIVKKMTLQEKCNFLSGATSFSLHSISRLGIPTVLLADGPVGLRNHAPHSTLYPSSILSASTWNRNLIYQLGQSLGDDARARGVGILLGPGVNIYRSPLCGRNYEYFGEDPYLVSEVASQYIEGVQSRGVISTIKHFAGNNQEWNRHHVNSEIDERTLFEIYFPAFQKAVQKAHVGAVMNSYNLLNGVHATENAWLNKHVLRRQWGFEGILMSDWTSVYSTIGTANHGLDLEMPKGKHLNYELLKEAIENGTVDMRTIDEKVQHILQTLISFGILDRQQKDSSIPLDYPSSRETALKLAREGVVLLKNKDNILPLKGITALVGPNASVIPTGGGSGNVEPFASIALDKGMKALAPATIMLTDDVIYEDINTRIFADSICSRHGFTGEYFRNKGLRGAPSLTRIDSAVDFDWQYGTPAEAFPVDTFSTRWTGYYRPEADETVKLYIGGDDGYRIRIDGKQVAGDWGNHSYSYRELSIPMKGNSLHKIEVEYFENISSANIKLSLKRLDQTKLSEGLAKADNVVYCCGFNSSIEGEGFDRPFQLPEYQREMIENISAANPRTVIVINAGGGIDMDDWIDKVKGVVMAWYPGQEGGQALAEILTGKLSPSGKLPISIERKWEDNPCHDSYYENTKEREVKTVEYREGIFIGYRGYDKSNIQPLFPFGYGLSYSRFQYSDLKLEKEGRKGVRVTFTLKNIGSMEAKETAEVYVSDPQSTVVRPAKELKGFEKVSLLPGESKRISIWLDESSFAYYDVVDNKFKVEPGSFVISVGPSSAELVLKSSITL